jgi:hypothetical protein
MGSSFSPSDLYIYRSDQKRCSLSLKRTAGCLVAHGLVALEPLDAKGYTLFLTNCCTSFFRVRKLPDAFFGMVVLRTEVLV